MRETKLNHESVWFWAIAIAPGKGGGPICRTLITQKKLSSSSMEGTPYAIRQMASQPRYVPRS